MLSELAVEGLGVIDRAELELDRGCVALTGETGAGKTLVVAALSLLLGGRADRTLIRYGANEARVEGRFLVPADHPAATLLRAHGVADDPAGAEFAELVFSRSVAADGRGGKARINGRLAPAALLAEAGSTLVEIAGQHEHHRLASPAHQRRLLDAFGGPDVLALAAGVAAAVAAARATRRRADDLQATERERRRELDSLAFEIAEIEAAALTEGEEAGLMAEATRLEHAEALATGIGVAIEALHGEGGAGDLLAGGSRELSNLIATDPALEPLANRVAAAEYEISDVAQTLAGRITAPDPEALATLRDRLDSIARLRRKYGADEGAVLAYLDRARTRAAELQAIESDSTGIEEKAAAEAKEAESLAARLSDARARAAGALTEAMHGLLKSLAIEGAVFEVALDSCDLFEGGRETVEFRVATNSGEKPRPVAKIASGGELSRISLALHLLTSSGDAETMIFDEVDAGVGGEAARAVGKALKELSSRGEQVIVVTHLPQVAAFADVHFRVVKETVEGRASARVEGVTGAERIEELSRMLAGLPESRRAREHAQELLEMAGRTSP